MKKNIAKLWTSALRSGDYKQGYNSLHLINKHNEETFCCLGVLCDLYQKDRRKKKKKMLDVNKTAAFVVEYNAHGASLPSEVMRWAGIATALGDFGFNSSVGACTSLANLNDGLGYDFNYIAKFIEDNVEVL